MPSLSVAEKQHGKERIARTIDTKIEAVTAADPGLLDRIEEQARRRALQALGLADMEAELDAVTTQRAELDQREWQAHRTMLAAVRRVPVEEVDENRHHQHPDVFCAVRKRQAVHEDELLAEDERGKEVPRLRQEKENLLDTVWLATLPAEVRRLEKEWPVELPPGTHRLSVLAHSAVSSATSEVIEVTYTPKAAPKDARPGSYVLAIGIDDYPGDLKLDCAVNDARGLTDTLGAKS